jgi:hypothetical protein
VHMSLSESLSISASVFLSIQMSMYMSILLLIFHVHADVDIHVNFHVHVNIFLLAVQHAGGAYSTGLKFTSHSCSPRLSSASFRTRMFPCIAPLCLYP